jgi:tRNA (guanine-N7-)-methyltransferase
MRLKSKPWAKPLISEHPELIQTDQDPIVLKTGFQHYALEIGTGKGDFIAGKSLQQPQTFFYGIERVTTVVAFALKKVLLTKPLNIKLILGDFAKASFAIPDSFFDEIYLNFSDPWPKLRHHKRRLTAMGNLEKITRILKPYGRIIMKTDNLDLFMFSIGNLNQMSYNIVQIQQPYVAVESTDIMTEYESFFRKASEPIYRLIAQKE